MAMPTLTDYVRTLYSLFDRFAQAKADTEAPKQGCPFTYADKGLIVFFLMMQFRAIHRFKAQRRWLVAHAEMLPLLRFDKVPHRTTLSRRYKRLYPSLQEFVAFTAEFAKDLDEAFSNQHLVEDKSLFQAKGPVWHQKDRKAGHIPSGLRGLDTEASWSKSAYRGWVYGYGLHLTCNEAAFPQLVAVETASISESAVLEHKAEAILERLCPQTLTADNAYAKALRIRSWARQGVALITPALKWVKGRYAEAYHRFIKEPENQQHLKKRRTSVEPLFDLVAQSAGIRVQPKSLPVQRLGDVRSCLALATLSVQLAMVVNSIYGLPLRTISAMATAFT